MDPAPPKIELTRKDLADLRYAKSLLENPGLTARLSNLIGGPIEKGFKMLPKNWTHIVNQGVRSALFKALELAVVTLDKTGRKRSSEFFHKVMVGASGGLGGAFGLASLPVELPISTTLMLRSIADIARSEGHDLSDIRTKLFCLEVFALGGRIEHPGSGESTYWAVRAALSRTITEAAAYFTEKGVLEKSAPAILRLISAISSRFGVVVSEQVAAKAIPVVGAAGGAVINVLFINHFQDMARGHFIVKRLEKEHSSEIVRTAYDQLPPITINI